jgi:hypothetical protein
VPAKPSTSPSQTALPVSNHRAVVIIGGAIVFCVVWLFRWLTVDFTNDHFVHLSRGRQILLGEWPVRDFFDPGLPLHYFASAAALRVFGQTLLGEAILTVTMIAAGAALTFHLSARTSRSTFIALIATATAVSMFPRLYNYPKVFLYPLALVAVWHYASRRTTFSVVLLASVTAIATLFRLDHGVYIGGSMVVALLLANIGSIRLIPRQLGWFTAVAGALLLPFVVFIQMSTGLVEYVVSLRSQVESVTTARVLSMPFAIDTKQPWVVVDPPSRPRIFVRWKPGTDADIRAERERQYGLVDGTDDGSYLLTSDRRDIVEALVYDPLVADTHNIDRATFRPIVSQSWLQRARNRFPLLRTHLAPGVITPTNALAWLYYLTVLVPVVALVMLVAVWRRGGRNQLELVVIATAIVMCVVIDQALLRGSPDSRLPDVAGPTMVLAAWITAAAVQRSSRRAMAAVAVIVWIGTLGSATLLGEMGERIIATGVLAGPTVTRDRMREVGRLVSMRPIDFYAPAGSTGVRGLTRYVLECTRPSQRILTGSFEPQIVFYAERAFAGGQVYLKNGWHSAPASQRLTVERMKRQQVPLVLFNASTEEEVRRAFPLVYQYVKDNYRETARSGFGAAVEYAVLVKRDLQPRSVYDPFNLPCYR